MSQTLTSHPINFYSDTYRDSFSRINGIVIEGEQQAHDNFISLSELLPEDGNELTRLAKMESGHRKSFEACGRNLEVTPDLNFAQGFFADLHQVFQEKAAENKIASCLLIQSLIIECFAIAAYNKYIPVADDFAAKITTSVVKDEYTHLNFGEVWLKANLQEVKQEVEATNRQTLPLIWRMLNQVESDAKVIGMNKQELIEEFILYYAEALERVGFSTRDILRMSSHSLI